MTTQVKQFKIKKGGDATGTHLHGYIKANYSDVVKVLGEPGTGDEYKTDAEWEFKVNGKQMTLYNYKDGKNYLQAEGLETTEITDWHVGANDDISEEAAFLAEKLNSTFQPLKY